MTSANMAVNTVDGSAPQRTRRSPGAEPFLAEANIKEKDEVDARPKQKELAHKGRSLNTDHWSTKCLTILASIA